MTRTYDFVPEEVSSDCFGWCLCANLWDVLGLCSAARHTLLPTQLAQGVFSAADACCCCWSHC